MNSADLVRAVFLSLFLAGFIVWFSFVIAAAIMAAIG